MKKLFRSPFTRKEGHEKPKGLSKIAAEGTVGSGVIADVGRCFSAGSSSSHFVSNNGGETVNVSRGRSKSLSQTQDVSRHLETTLTPLVTAHLSHTCTTSCIQVWSSAKKKVHFVHGLIIHSNPIISSCFLLAGFRQDRVWNGKQVFPATTRTSRIFYPSFTEPGRRGSPLGRGRCGGWRRGRGAAAHGPHFPATPCICQRRTAATRVITFDKGEIPFPVI